MSDPRADLIQVVIGRLISSTVLTLLVLPTVFAWLEERQDSLERRRQRPYTAAVEQGLGPC